MNRKPVFFLFILAVLGLSSCAPGRMVKLSKTHNVVFLDSLAASEAILDDDQENFFDKIGKTDMSIQMGVNYPPETLRGKVLYDYKNFLRADVTSFTGKEKKMLKGIMKDIYGDMAQISPDLFPTEIELIKTHAKHYGHGVYYTRENRIIIPEDALVTKDKDKKAVEKALTQTMIHEIFHIYSRYHPKERRELYGLIGFKNMFGLPMIMDDPLKERVLLNPDGIDVAQIIDIKSDPNTISAIPLIVATQTTFDESKPSFFQYLKFDLYQVIRKGSAIRVISKEDGSSTLNLKELPDYFRQIRDNTQYIIHPDEIMADNFMFLVMAQDKPSSLERFSPEGRELLKEIERILKK